MAFICLLIQAILTKTSMACLVLFGVIYRRGHGEHTRSSSNISAMHLRNFLCASQSSCDSFRQLSIFPIGFNLASIHACRTFLVNMKILIPACTPYGMNTCIFVYVPSVKFLVVLFAGSDAARLLAQLFVLFACISRPSFPQ